MPSKIAKSTDRGQTEGNIEYRTARNTKEELDRVLHPLVKKWFYGKFKEFSIPQKMAVMEIHSRRNILVSAPTGATKTLTGFLSILNELVDSAVKGILEDKIYALYISPLKALNNDIQKNLIEPLREIEEIYGKSLGIRIVVRTGDTTASEKSKMLKNSPHILITTPESLAILLTSIKFSNHLKDVSWTIIDEIHALADNKRGVHLAISMERLQRHCPGMARVGLSATVAPLEEVAKFLVGTNRDCMIVDVQYIKKMDIKVLSPVPDLIQTTFETMQKKSYDMMHRLIQEHTTTVIFTNTRAATERVVHNLKERFPSAYGENIAAHHGSLSKDMRFSTEENLRNGKLKVVVSSTSLELGIDIGFVDLVILLGSPKSVARALQRIGRAGHKLHATTKGRIIVLDRDDLVECAVLLKAAVEKKIDRIHIPENCLDVLAQQIYGIAIEQRVHKYELFDMIKQSYPYRNLSNEDYNNVLDYLSGEHITLEERYVYGKIWIDPETNLIGRRGRMARIIYMTNIGTIPDESFVTVKIGNSSIGKIDEAFLERLRRGDIFVLGGFTYQFQYASGMVAQVLSVAGRKPTVPQWFSDMLPLSFDLSQEISKFRLLVADKLESGELKEDILKFIHEYLYLDENGANAIYEYINEQFLYSEVPNNRKLVVEHYNDQGKKYCLFHSLYGRRVNDVLSRAFGFVVSRTQMRDVNIGITDNGFYLTAPKQINVKKALEHINSEVLLDLLKQAIDGSEVLKRRFRHCAGRSLMILRNYKGKRKRVGRQQVSSMLLLSAVKRISEEFCILKEARREVLSDLMDIENAVKVLKWIEQGKVQLKEVVTDIPSPFAFNLITHSYADIIKMEDKQEFLKRMHDMVRLKISLNRHKRTMNMDKYLEEQRDKERRKKIDDMYDEYYGKDGKTKEIKSKRSYDPSEIDDDAKEILNELLNGAARHIGLDSMIHHECRRLIKGDREGFKPDFIKWYKELFFSGDVPTIWPKELADFFKKIRL